MAMTTKSEPEQRSLVRPVEVRGDADKMTVVGYAAVFGEEADIYGWFTETVARGAFTNTLKTADIRAYFDHDRGRVLGRLSSGTLRLKEDDKGLAVEIDLPVAATFGRLSSAAMSAACPFGSMPFDRNGTRPLIRRNGPCSKSSWARSPSFRSLPMTGRPSHCARETRRKTSADPRISMRRPRGSA
jgi:hypothetical protein